MISETLAELVVPIETLRPYERNPRRGNLEAIKASLEAHGQYRPVVARTNGEVLAGNHTLAAALELGWTQLAVTYVDVDDEQATRIVLVDNRTSDLAVYDDGTLRNLLASLDGLDGTGWRAAELSRLADTLDENPGRDTEPGPLPAAPLARAGDAWELGEHRLLCGSSTDAGDVERLLGEQFAEMVWTDPPYGVDYTSATGLGMQGDRPYETYDLLLSTLELALEHTLAGGAIYLMHADGDPSASAHRALRDAGWEIHQRLIWVKDAFVLSRQDYHWQHEPILYGWRPGAAHRWAGDATDTTVEDDETDLRDLDKGELIALVKRLRNERRTTVVREDRPRRADLHPTVKPVGLVAGQIANSSRRGELVYDPFGGSGTTLLACENLARRCVTMEIDPVYCDVIVDRWQRHTGLKAKRERRRARATA